MNNEKEGSHSLTYKDTMRVEKTWNKVKDIPGYEYKLGPKILEYMLEEDPTIKAVFNISAHENIHASPIVAMQGKPIMNMIDCFVSWLGPDMDIMLEDLHDTGRRHAKYGVKPKHYFTMERALFRALKKTLGASDFSKEDEEAWHHVFKFVDDGMVDF